MHTGGLLDDADYANRHIYLYGYRFTVDMEYVCRRFGLCRTERRDGFDRAYILIFVDGAEVWRRYGRGGCDVDTGILRL